MRTILIAVSVLLVTGPALAAGLEIDKAGGAFTLTDPGGKEISLEGMLKAEGTSAVIVQIASTTCPFSQRADRDFIPFAKKIAEKGVRVVALFPNVHEPAGALKRYANRVKMPYPHASDPLGKTAKAFGASVTPTFYLFDKGGVLRFRGSLAGLKKAVDSVLAGETVASKNVAAIGCSIKWKKGDFVPPPQEGGRPDGPPAPPPLSKPAQAWLAILIENLKSEDKAVVSSADAGIVALGQGAIPHLERARESADPEFDKVLEQAIEHVRRPRRLNSNMGRRSSGGAGIGPSMLEQQLRALEGYFNLTDEQKKIIRGGFMDLRDMENEIRAAYRRNERGGTREKMTKLREESQKIVKKALTAEQWKEWEGMRTRTTRRGGRTPDRKEGGNEGGKEGGGGR